MYRCILAPLDGTAAGERAIPLAARIAELSGAALHLVHVQLPLAVPPGANSGALAGLGDLIQDEPDPKYLERIGHELRGNRGIEVVEATLQGPVAPTLEKYAADCGMSLVVMNMEEHARLDSLWGHGVAEHVTRSLQIPVLLTRSASASRAARGTSAADLHHFLLPMDGGEHCGKMVEHAIILGALFDARYTLIRVVEQPRAEDSDAVTFQQAEDYLEVIARGIREHGLEVVTRVIFADRPSRGIVAVASDRDLAGLPIDCIVMASRSQSGLTQLLGSHTLESVVRDSPMTMLLFEAQSESARRTVAVPGLSVE
jgi:nucleotide-binding universal stress UspA family protein